MHFKLVPYSLVFSGSPLLVCPLDGKWVRRSSEWSWPGSSWLTSLLLNQNKHPRRPEEFLFVCSFNKVRMTAPMPFCCFCYFKRHCQDILIFRAIPTYIPAMLFFPRKQCHCTLAAAQGELSCSHQGPAQHQERLLLLPHCSLALRPSLQSEVIMSK